MKGKIASETSDFGHRAGLAVEAFSPVGNPGNPNQVRGRGRKWVTERQRLGAKLDPALREWADRVIIPALADEYFAERERKRIADVGAPVAQSETKSRLSAGGTP